MVPFVSLLLSAAALWFPPPDVDMGWYAGDWEGVLDFNGTKLRTVFHLAVDEDGELGGTVDSPDQNAIGLPLSSVDWNGDGTITIAMRYVNAEYVCALEGGRLVGTWDQGGMRLPLECDRTEGESESAAPSRPQLPEPPFPYRSEEVRYDNEEADVTLAGTLTLPEGDGPFAAALLITGSGKQDRDESLMGHKPFLVIADHLTRRGIAVLRVDDRGVGGSTGGDRGETTEDFAGDALSGVRFLRGRDDIDADRVGLIGHSEGGLIAPMVAAGAPDDVAFIVLMAGPGVTGEEILYLQSDLISRVEGASDETIAANRRTQEKLFELVKRDDLSPDELDQAARAIFAEDPNVPEGEEGEALVEQQLRAVLSDWMRFFLVYDPRPILERVRCPVLAINGEKDLQVPPEQNLAEIGAALERGGNPDVTLEELASLNHLFQTAETGAVSEYAEIEETFSATALDLIADWIAARFGDE